MIKGRTGFWSFFIYKILLYSYLHSCLLNWLFLGKEHLWLLLRWHISVLDEDCASFENYDDCSLLPSIESFTNIFLLRLDIEFHHNIDKSFAFSFYTVQSSPYVHTLSHFMMHSKLNLHLWLCIFKFPEWIQFMLFFWFVKVTLHTKGTRMLTFMKGKKFRSFGALAAFLLCLGGTISLVLRNWALQPDSPKTLHNIIEQLKNYLILWNYFKNSDLDNFCRGFFYWMFK